MGRPEEEQWPWGDGGIGGLLWIEQCLLGSCQEGEQCGTGGDFVLHGSDGHGAMGLESGSAWASYRAQWSSISRNNRVGSPRQSWGDSHGWEPWADVLWVVS